MSGLQVCGRDDFIPTWIEKNFQRKFSRKPSRIFVNSMSDVADWEPDWFDRVAYRIAEHPEHRFLFLSKRPWDSRWIDLPNARLGYSATCQDDMDRLAKHGRGQVSFLSLEPIHGRIILSLLWIPKWIIIGSETGNCKVRVVPKTEWIREIFGFCAANKIPLFFKESLRTYWPKGAYFTQEHPKGGDAN